MWFRAAVAGCRLNEGICSKLAEGAGDTPPIRLGSAATSTLELACRGEFKNADACFWAGLSHLNAALQTHGRDAPLTINLTQMGVAYVPPVYNATTHTMDDVAPTIDARARAEISLAVDYFNIGCWQATATIDYTTQSPQYKDAAAPVFPTIQVVPKPGRSCIGLKVIYGHHYVPLPSPDILRDLETQQERASGDIKAALREQSSEFQSNVKRLQDAAAAQAQRDAEFAQGFYNTVNANAPSSGSTQSSSVAPVVKPRPNTTRTRETVAQNQLARDQAFQEAQAKGRTQQQQTQARQAERALQLQQCLAQPITPSHVVQTNPFLAHAQTFQTLLDKLRRACGASRTWAQWNDCMGGNAMDVFWSDEDRAVADSAALFTRYRAIAGNYSGPPVCLEGSDIHGTRSDCLANTATLEVERTLCATRLQADIDKLSCDSKMLPGVWDAEDARNDATARTQHEIACKQQFGN